MKLNADYHTHTIFSHGKGTIEDNVLKAIDLGLKEIGITDHGYGHLYYGVKKAAIADMRSEVDRLNIKYPQIKVLLGMEANILNTDGDVDIDDVSLAKLDYLIAGYHFGSAPVKWLRDFKFHAVNVIARIIPALKKYSEKQNTKAVVNAIKKYDLFAVTHPGAKGQIDVKAVAEAATKKGTLLEINTRHGFLTIEGIKIAKMLGARFLVSSDAHHPNCVGMVDEALKRVEQSGLVVEDVYNLED